MTDSSPEAPSTLDTLAPALAAVAGVRPGATFFRADLQIHTPLDPQFPETEPSDPAERRALAARYLQAAKDRGIEVVGITEHNDVSWIEELRYAAQLLDMQLLPGFEVESKEGVHVLCLFEPDASVSGLEEILARLGLTAAKRASHRLELRTDKDFASLLEFIQTDCAGICIAAHIESNKGLLAALREGARVDAWKTPALLAAQVARPPNEIESGNGRILRGEDPIYARERLPGYILTSDARSFDGIGSISTWIKMDHVGVEGLRQAFLDPGSRIAYEDPGDLRLGGHILGVAWDGDFLDDVSVPINVELNCLIGGKGTGKSTAIESIRYAFGLGYRTDEVEDAATDLLAHAFRSGSKVSVLIETDAPARTRFTVERTAPHGAVVRDALGEARPDLDPSALIRPCIYGQKEIFGIAQNARARLEMLDGFARDDLRPLLEREKTQLEALRENGRVILDARRRIDDAEARLAELPNLEEWRRRFQKAGFDELLKERRQLEKEGRWLDQGQEALDSRQQALRGLTVDDDEFAVPQRDEELPNGDLLDEAANAMEAGIREWEAGLDELASHLTEVAKRLEEVRDRWQARRDARQTEFDAALRELQARMPDVDPERYLDVERRIEQLKPLDEALTTLRSRLESARVGRSKQLVELADARGEKHRIRRRAAERLNEALAGNVLVELAYQGEREDFLKRLAALKSGARSDSLRRAVEDSEFSPAAFAEQVRLGTLSDAFGLPAGQANALERTLTEDVLLELELAELPDSVELKLDVAIGEQSRDYRSLDRLSPGQKSTAILLLIMQESHDPLLIDQPEDDLDNRFIYDDVVKRLREAKKSRQFLIATHNANIPILGDAEQIVAFDAGERSGGVLRGTVRARGSIDSEPVRAAAEHILEGGHEAFELRRKKYAA